MEFPIGKYRPGFSLSIVFGMPILNGTVIVDAGNVPVDTPVMFTVVDKVNVNPSEEISEILLNVSKLSPGFLYLMIASLLIPIKFLPEQDAIPAVLIVSWSEIENDGKILFVKTVSATKSTLNPKEKYRLLVFW